MNVVRNEIRTGLMVLFCMAVLVGALIYLGAPGVFTPQKEFGIYFDNAAGIKLGTPVMLAGRKVGQVTEINSPVPLSERPMGKDNQPLPLEVRVMIRVDRNAQVYERGKVAIAAYGVLSEVVIDFTLGDETSGLAAEHKRFVGIRQGGLADAGAQLVEKIDPLVVELNETLKSLKSTSQNLTRLTAADAELPMAFAEVRKVAANLNTITGPMGSFPKAIESIEALAGKEGDIAKALADFRQVIGPDSDLAKSLANVEKFTKALAGNGDVPAALKNIRNASEKLNAAIAQIRSEFTDIAGNLEQATDTLKRQPWRLIWPGTKKYKEEEAQAPKPKVVPKLPPPPVKRKR